MLNHAARMHLPVFHDQLRTSVLGRSTARKMHNLHGSGAADEDEAKPSLATDEHVRKFFDAWRVGDGAAQTDALNKVVQTWRADNAAGGLGVHEHLPLPGLLARSMARMLGDMSEAAQPTLGKVIAELDPSAQTLVAQQIAGMMEHLRSLPGVGMSGDVERAASSVAWPWTVKPTSSDAFGDGQDISGRLRRFVYEPSEGRAREQRESGWENLDRSSVLHSLLESESSEKALRSEEWMNPANASEPLPWRGETGKTTSLQGAPFGTPPSQPQRKRRIVKPYRRYAKDGMGTIDTELQEADALALDADAHIQPVLDALLRDPSFDRSNDRLMVEFAAAMRRYYDADGDRAVAGVGTRFESASIDARDRYASYDPTTDRILFTKLFSGLSREEKIVTVIHEVLHATRSMKNLAASVGYHKDRIGGKVFAKHEAYLDNVAIFIAKKLGLIPQNYPTVDWRRYYDGRG
jgi:hypothetical protein